MHFACLVGWIRVADAVDGCNQSGMPFSGSMKSVVTNGTNYQALVTSYKDFNLKFQN